MIVIVGVSLVLIAVKVSERWLPKEIYRAGAVAYVLMPFIGLVYAIWRTWGRWVGPTELTLFVVFALLTGIGTGVGYHRMLTRDASSSSSARWAWRPGRSTSPRTT
jgi:fatty-acid desaturase